MSRSDRKEIWLIEDKDECSDLKTGEAVPIYRFVDPGDKYYAKESVKAKNGNKATLEDLVELCDQDAESVNAHDCVGMHRLLGAVLFEKLGRVEATQIMHDIAKRRGLHGMNGLRGLPDSFAELRVGESGHTWDGKYK